MMRASNMEPADLKQEFRNMLLASGWSQAEAARRLNMTPSALSQIVRPNSPVRPSPVTLQCFRLLLLREKPARPSAAGQASRPPGGDAWAEDLVQELRNIPAKSRQSIVDTLRALVAAAQKPRGRNGGASRNKPAESRRKIDKKT